MGIPLKVLFPVGVWQLWLHRNNFVFRTSKVDRSSFKRSIKESIEFFSFGMNIKLPKVKTIVAVGWEKPPVGWEKLNSHVLYFTNHATHSNTRMEASDAL